MTEREMKIRALNRAINDWQYGSESDKPEKLQSVIWMIQTIAREEAENLEAKTEENS